MQLQIQKYTKDLAIGCGVNSNKIKIINPGINPIEEINKKILNGVENLLKNYIKYGMLYKRQKSLITAYNKQ